MGIIDFVKGGVRELMIARPDGMKHLIVYKHPDGNIPTYARLTVDMDEVAVFFKSGSPPTVGALGPGRYPLSTENIPFLNHFVTSFTGGNIFQAEVFFVKNQPVRNLTFGGQMMSMRDPELDLRVTPRAYGTYSLVVIDPIRFIIGYSGQAAQGDNEQVTSWLRQRLFQGLGKTLGGFLKSGQTTFMDLGGVAPDLASAMLRDCPDFSEIGVRILEIGELKISVSPEDQARIDELQDQMAEAKLKARVAKVGVGQAEAEAQQKQFALDQQFQNESRYAGVAGSYQGYAAGRAMIGAGEGMARGGGDAGLAGAGAQMAVGVGMASWMQQGAVGRAPIPQAAAPAAAPGTKMTCPKCSAQVPSGKFCQECGSALAVAPPARFCSGCGGELGSAKFCANCGAQATSP
ncbi:MAG TPA: SPFH domain-containing protein [Polyangiaceae bacterium]|nr:SPFH domain-containing protein [Polyangiaceae bacterium]